MKVIQYTIGIIGALCFVAVIIGYTQSWWAVLIGALCTPLLCSSDEKPEPPSIPMVGPRTHDIEEGETE